MSRENWHGLFTAGALGIKDFESVSAVKYWHQYLNNNLVSIYSKRIEEMAGTSPIFSNVIFFPPLFQFYPCFTVLDYCLTQLQQLTESFQEIIFQYLDFVVQIALGELSVFHNRLLMESTMSWANVALAVPT